VSISFLDPEVNVMDKGRYGRKDRLIREKCHDTYMEKVKKTDGAFCRICGAVYEGGRWKWNNGPASGSDTTCPACQRISDNYPAGVLTIAGPFSREHRSEILNMVKNIEDQEKGEHPLERIMDVEKKNDTLTIRTTGIHLARRMGDALRRSYRGDYALQYENGDKAVRISWER
jgi:NMD protein affecting ribosome stability and mRNA decay